MTILPWMCALALPWWEMLSPGQGIAGSAPPPTEIRVTAKVIKRIEPELFLGVNWDFTARTHSLREIFNEHRSEFATFIAAHGVKLLRYPGGEYSHWFFPGVPFEKWHGDFQRHLGAPTGADEWIELSEFLSFLREGNFQAIFQVNTKQYWDNEKNQVLPVKSRQGLAVARVVASAEILAKLLKTIPGKYYIEIGNEDYTHYTPEEYAAIAYETMTVLKKTLPGVRIIITGQSLSGPIFKNNARLINWTEKVLQILARKGAQGMVDYIAHHDYSNALPNPAGNPPNNLSESSADEEWHRYMAYDSTTDLGWKNYTKQYPVGVSGKSPLSLLNDILQKYGYQNTKIWITEYRNGWLTNRYSKALAGGLGNLNLLINYVNCPSVSGAVIHSLIHATRVSRAESRPFLLWGWNILEYAPALSQRFIATPVLQALSLLNHVLQGNEVLQTETSDPQLSIVCCRRGGYHYLLVINRDLDTTHRVYLRLPQLGESWQARGQSWVWTSKNVGDYAVDYGSFDKVHQIQIAQSSFTISANSIVSFPPHSASVFEFQASPK